ncbi:MAG: SpoIIE family protein phosphatase [Clostridia bacterium]|nr:SpoIIE family protein phosphatase [Clostridia bacterium]
MALEKLLHVRFTQGQKRDGAEGITLGAADLLRFVKGVGMALFSFLLGSAQAAFSCYPFGISFLCVVDRMVPWSYIGLLVSSLFSRGYAVITASIYTAAFALRFGLGRWLAARPEGSRIRAEKLAAASVHVEKKRGHIPIRDRLATLMQGEGMFGESILLRCAVSCFSAFVFGLYRLVEGGFLYYDLFGLLLGFFLCPALTLALSGLFTKNEQLAAYREISAGTLMFITVYALRGYTFFGFSPALVVALFVTFWAASGGGALRGCTVGLVAGIASGSEVSAMVPCMVAAAGLVTGLLWKFSKVAAIAASCVAGLALGISGDGFAVLQRLLPDTLGAAVIYLPLAYYGILPRLPVFVQQTDNRSEEAMILEKKQKDTVLRMNALSEAFGRLSDVIYTLSDRLRRPGIIDLKQVCDSSFDACCSKCSLASLCWERECTSTLDAQSKITTELYTKGRIEVSEVPGYIRERCYNIEKIVSQINLDVAALVERLVSNDKTEAFAVDYEALSKLLAESISEGENEYTIDEELTKKLRRSLRYMDMASARAICYGSRKKQVIIGGVDLARVRIGADELRRAVENTVKTKLTEPRFAIEGENVTVTLSARRRFRVENARATSVKEQESANGDTATMFENGEDYYYALISDGMGSGREAAVTSKLCAVFTEQMLGAGNGKAVTLQMLNGFIRSRGVECSATIDLAEIDLITGEACFVKSGAAPSYILRSGNLYKLQSKTVPIGIMSALDAEQIRFSLTEGDIIIMLSDGVAQSLEDGVWLANLLTYEWEDNLQLMAEKILDNAALNNKRSDDMTVALMRVSEPADMDEN